jgi:hypothetical protein
MKNIIIYLIVRKQARRAGLLGFNKIPYKIVFQAIEQAKKEYQKGKEEDFTLVIARNSFASYFKKDLKF